MRKFIVSDLHGDGNIYNSIISYLENVAMYSNEKVELYINGDLIDRGYASGDMLVDVIDRCNYDNLIDIKYLAGNHEYMMWLESFYLKDGKWRNNSHWVYNGGYATSSFLERYLTDEETNYVINFISNLKLYHKFEEKICGKKIVLVHSKCPSKVSSNCNLKIKDNTDEVYDLVWSRAGEDGVNKVGNKNYFTIIGHTAVNTPTGFMYDRFDNVMNIDGGCAYYMFGVTKYDHVPLVEVEDEKLTILTFNNNNEIIYGNSYSNGEFKEIDNLDEYRKFLNPKVKLLHLYKKDGDYFFAE